MAGYGVDVLDPAVTPRRVAVLVERLPPFARGPGEEWSTEADLLALLIDHVANLTWITLRAHGSKAARPRPVPRPRHRTIQAGTASGSRGAVAAEPGQVKHGSWAEAIGAMAGIPGVEVDRQ